MDVLEYELSELENNYHRVFKHLQELGGYEKQFPGTIEIISRMLTSKILHGVCGGYEKFGYTHWKVDAPIDRMDFVNHFVAHELMGDGNPALCWHRCRFFDHEFEGDELERFQAKMKLPDAFGWVPCAEDNEGAIPWWSMSHESMTQPCKHLFHEDVLSSLDFHDKVNKELYEANNQNLTEDPMMVQLVKDLFGGDSDA